MPAPADFQANRNDLDRFLRRRLLGPGGAADLRGIARLYDVQNPAAEQPEVLLGSPTIVYHTGILFPPARLSEVPLDQDEPVGEDAEAPESDIEETSDFSVDNYADSEVEESEGEVGPRRLPPASADGESEPEHGPDDLTLSPDPLRNFSQLYPRHMGLSCCVGATTEAATLRLQYRRYEAPAHFDKRRIGLLLTDYPANPHYDRLLADASYGPVLGRYFAIRKDHAAGPLLIVRELPNEKNKEEYDELSRAIQRLRREADHLFRSKQHRGSASEETTRDAGDSGANDGGGGHATTGHEEALIKHWDRSRYASDPKERSSEEFRKLTDQVDNLQKLHYAYQAFQRLALPLRSTDAYNTYWLAREESFELTLNLAAWRPQLRHGRFDTCWVYEAGSGEQPASLCGPGEMVATGHRFRVRLLLRQDSRYLGNLFIKVQVENFSEPVLVDAGGPYPSYDVGTARHCLFGMHLAVDVPEGLLPYKKAGEAGSGTLLAEDKTTEFIYRHAPPYAIGHGVAAEWNGGDGSPDTSGAITRAETNYLPYKDVPDISPVAAHPLSAVARAPLLPNDEVLRFQWLADFGHSDQASDDEVRQALGRFLNYYQHWIRKQQQEALDGNPAEASQINREMACCRVDLDRMYRNIGLLDDAHGIRAFRLANAAMFVQLWHGRYVGKNMWRPTDPANAVFQQFALEKKRTGHDGFSPGFYATVSDKLRGEQPAAWRPFQLAFILLNLDGFIRPDATSTQRLFDLPALPTNWHERNELVDLVWFPTGGGKTEAYLGLIAFCAIHRRLAFPLTGGGTAVLMRYTLRLLTLQQFQRATRLIVSMEIVHHWPGLQASLGAEPFSIGLWVGSKFLPNKLLGGAAQNGRKPTPGLLDISSAIAAKLLDYKREFEADRSEENRRHQETRARAECGKIPVVACPCCGTDMFDVTTGRYGGPVIEGNGSTFSCLGKGCLFGPSPDVFESPPYLPILLCDELLYRHPPTLLFGTVDKFAALAHKVENGLEDTRRLFGRRPATKPQQRPPDLIIQDELHLLQGPLGSSVALFEAVLDQLCRVPDATINGFVRAKVISSTATTRNTGLQVWALYDRQVNVFPKPGVRADDSFFAVYKRDPATDHVLSKRRYLGVCPTGKTLMTTQRHLLGLLLAHRLHTENQAAINGLELSPAQDADQSTLLDAYYSIVSYFGSLREVGKTASQIDTFLKADYLRLLDELLLTQPMHYSYRYLRTIELTGRMNDNQVKAALALAEEPYRLNSREQITRATPDLLLATSMISVGIDIGRLNVMLINGMPKSMAEYIQASSRVAREYPGLVVTLHHPMRPRDISHFEHFSAFHDRLYAFVEPLSITPFTAKALVRYLPTVLAALVRQSQAEFAPNTSAGTLTSDQAADLVSLITDYYQQRHARLQHLDETVVGDNVRHLLGADELTELEVQTAALIKQWERRRDEMNPELSQQLAFGVSPNNLRLYADLNAVNAHPDQWRVNYSLREIEPQTALKIEQE